VQARPTLPLNLFQGGWQWHGKKSEVSQISQTFFENCLLGFIEYFGIVADKFPKHKLQEQLQVSETIAKLLFR
jgi:hypothetical protein